MLKATNKVNFAWNDAAVAAIAVINQARTPVKAWKSGSSFAGLVKALQLYANLVARTWGVVGILRNATVSQAHEWELVFVDDSDQADALGYHDTTPAGLPRGLVFVKPTIGIGDAVSSTAAHELAEMLVDPCINLCAQRNDGVVYAYEVCDAVEEEEFSLGGVAMSNFVLPAWFEEFPRPRRDYMGTCHSAFEIRPGGYMPVFKDGDWTQIFGSAGAAERYAARAAAGVKRRRSRCDMPSSSAADAAPIPATSAEPKPDNQ